MSSLNIQISGNSVMEQNVRAVETAYNALTLATKVEGVTWAFGRVALNNNIGPPTIIWVPESGTIEPPDNIGGGLTDGGTTNKGRSLADRLLSFRVYCNGKSYEQAENLVVSVIAATRAALQVGTEFTDETWVTEQEGVSDTALNHYLAVLGVSMRMPVLDQSGGLTVITTQTHTEDIDNDLDC